MRKRVSQSFTSSKSSSMSFNGAVKEMLAASGVDSDMITILSA